MYLRLHARNIYISKLINCTRKVTLSCFDDKRYLLEDGVTSYAYGNRRITNSGVTTQNEKHDAKKASESNESKDCIPHSVNSEGVGGASQ
jgi:hypothetical protein